MGPPRRARKGADATSDWKVPTSGPAEL